MFQFGNQILGGQSQLIRQAIRSPNFVHGVSGWTINKDGSAEFNNVIIRGGEVVDGISLFYDPSPALGNLTASIAALAGTDSFGNKYLPGITSYFANSIALQSDAGQLAWYQLVAGNWVLEASVDWGSGSGMTIIGSSSVATAIGQSIQVSSGPTGFIQLTNNLSTGLVYYGPSGDISGATDKATLNFLLSVGNTVVLLPGIYYVNGPIDIPPYTVLQGSGGPMSLGIGVPPAPGTNVPSIVAVSSWAPGADTGVIRFLSQTPGGWPVPAQQQTVSNLIIDCSQNLSSHVLGVFFKGPCYDTHLTDLFIYNPQADGISAAGQSESGITPTFPYHQRWIRVNVADAGNIGANVTNFTDSTYTDCLMFANHGTNWLVNNCSNSQFIGCRAEWSNTSDGWQISGTSGSVTFTGCTTDHNSGSGFHLTGANGQTNDGGGIIITGGKLHCDGQAGTGNGIRIAGSNVPVTISGVNVEVGINSASFFPGTAVSLASVASVVVAGCTLQGDSSAWSWDASGVVARSGCIGATGNPGSQVFTRLTDI